MNEMKRYFEDIKEDEPMPSFEITITRTHIIKYGGAGGDFYPVHHDEEYAKSVGLPSIFAMGMMQGGMLSRVVTDWATNGMVKRYKLRFAEIVWPNDTLIFKGRVKRKYVQKEEFLVDCILSAINQNGKTALDGETTISFPSKNR